MVPVSEVINPTVPRNTVFTALTRVEFADPEPFATVIVPYVGEAVLGEFPPPVKAEMVTAPEAGLLYWSTALGTDTENRVPATWEAPAESAKALMIPVKRTNRTTGGWS